MYKEGRRMVAGEEEIKEKFLVLYLLMGYIKIIYFFQKPISMNIIQVNLIGISPISQLTREIISSIDRFANTVNNIEI